jgi:predicted transcriptional regulator of viral defense system
MNATAFYQKLAAHKRVTTREASQLTGLRVPAASMALRRLAAEGLATPLKRGHWMLGKPTTRAGIMVTAAADPYPAYLSGWSALRIHDRIQQIPARHFAITLDRPGDKDIAGTIISLHHITPELFDGYEQDPRAEGFVASSEKALFDLAYLAAMNRSAVSGNLPETDLRRLRWSAVKDWIARIRRPALRQAVESQVQRIRQQHAEVGSMH